MKVLFEKVAQFFARRKMAEAITDWRATATMGEFYWPPMVPLDTEAQAEELAEWLEQITRVICTTYEAMEGYVIVAISY